MVKVCIVAGTLKMKRKLYKIGVIVFIALALTVRVKGSYTYEELTNRNGRIYIEVVDGVVLDEEGNGKQLNALPDNGDYIAYNDKYNAGDKVTSIFIYNPFSNAEDDRIIRIDYNTQSGLNVK